MILPCLKLRAIGPAAALVCVAFSACAPEVPSELRIGLLALSDEAYWEASGEPSVSGARMAVNEINEAGGILINGRHTVLRLIVRKYEGRPDAASTAARALLNQDSVHVLLGPQISAHAIPVSVVAEDAGTLMISPMSSSPETTRGKHFVFRLASTDRVLAEAIARYSVEAMNAHRGAVLFDEAGAYSRELAAGFEESFVDAGGVMVAAERYTTDQARDFSEQLGRIAAARPDVLFLPNPVHHDSAQMRQAREMGVEATFVGADSWDLLGYAEYPWAEGAVVAHQWHYDLSAPEVASFVRRYTAIYDRRPRTTAAMTYDAVGLLAEAARAAGSLDPEALRMRISGLKEFHGATGLISFNGTGDPRRSIAITGVTGGEAKNLGIIFP